MVYRVVSTKLTEEEHSALLDECARQGESPSAFVKKAILEALKVEKSQLPLPSESVTTEEKKAQPLSEASKLNAILEKFIKETLSKDEKVKADNSEPLPNNIAMGQKQKIPAKAEENGELCDQFGRMSLVERLCASKPSQSQGGRCHVYYRCR